MRNFMPRAFFALTRPVTPGFQRVRSASSRLFNDLKILMTKTSILKFLSILHTLILPDDETCAPHDFNHNKGSR